MSYTGMVMMLMLMGCSFTNATDTAMLKVVMAAVQGELCAACMVGLLTIRLPFFPFRVS